MSLAGRLVPELLQLLARLHAKAFRREVARLFRPAEQPQLVDLLDRLSSAASAFFAAIFFFGRLKIFAISIHL